MSTIKALRELTTLLHAARAVFDFRELGDAIYKGRIERERAQYLIAQHSNRLTTDAQFEPLCDLFTELAAECIQKTKWNDAQHRLQLCNRCNELADELERIIITRMAALAKGLPAVSEDDDDDDDDED